MSVWDNFMKCFKQGGKVKGCTIVKLADIYSRVPPNQHKQFKEFAAKSEAYKIRLSKFPSRLPNIDWDYYKQNVRDDYVDWVEDFQKKYDNLDTVFGDRHTVIDHTKYFGDLVKETEVVTKCIEEYKKESNDRILCLEHKMDYLKNLKSYNEMTMEEYCFAHPDCAPDFRNKPTFWPHTAEEQKPGPIEEHHPHEEEEKPKPKGAKPTPKGDKPPPAAPSDTPPAAAAPSGTAVAEPKEATKKEAEKKPAAPPKAEKPKANVAKVEKKEESQAVEMVSQYAAKGVEFAKLLIAKVCAMVQGLYQKADDKRRLVADTANAERQRQSKPAATKPKKDDDDDLLREGSPSICHKTIIRGEDTAKADVKKKHSDLDIESDPEHECREKKKAQCKEDKSDCKSKQKCKEEEEEDVCERKQKCKEEVEEDVCDAKPKCPKFEDPCKSKKPKKCLKLNVKRKDEDETKCQTQNIDDNTDFTQTQINPVMGKSTHEFKTMDARDIKTVCEPKENQSAVVQSSTDSSLKSEPIKSETNKPLIGINQATVSKNNIDINSNKLPESTKTDNLRIFASSESIKSKYEKCEPVKTSTTKDKPINVKEIIKNKNVNQEIESAGLKIVESTKTENLNIFSSFESNKSVSEKCKANKPSKAENNHNYEEANKIKQDTTADFDNVKSMKSEGLRIYGKSDFNKSKDKQVEPIKDKPKYLKQIKKENTVNQELESAGLEMAKKFREDRAKKEQNLNASKAVKQTISESTIRGGIQDKKTFNKTKKQNKASISEPKTLSSELDMPTKDAEETEKMGSDEMAKQMFELATKSATLLSEAKKLIQQTKILKPDTENNILAAYEAAEQQVARALSQANKALEAAKQLTERAEADVKFTDKNAILLIEKHAMLAKLLAQRALTMKKEISKILNGLKKTE